MNDLTILYLFAGAVLIYFVVSVVKGFGDAEKTINENWRRLLAEFERDYSKDYLTRESIGMVHGLVTIDSTAMGSMVMPVDDGILVWNMDGHCVVLPWESIVRADDGNFRGTKLFVTIRFADHQQLRIKIPWRENFELKETVTKIV